MNFIHFQTERYSIDLDFKKIRFSSLFMAKELEIKWIPF